MSVRRRIGNRRRIGFRDPKKFFFISMEGKETEPRYFEEFKTGREAEIQIKLVPNPKHKSRPREVLQRLESYLRNNARRAGDECWLVIDRDAWEETELNEVCRAAAAAGHSVALSNPCFELWLYLHLHDNRPFLDRHDCQRALAAVLTDYAPEQKSAYVVNALLAAVDGAIRRAEALDDMPHQPWPRHQCTRVYRLVSKLRSQS